MSHILFINGICWFSSLDFLRSLASDSAILAINHLTSDPVKEFTLCHTGLTYIFTARRYDSAVLAVIVCLSVRLSQVGVVQRWLNLGSD